MSSSRKTTSAARSSTQIPVDAAAQANQHLSSSWNGTAGLSQATLVDGDELARKALTSSSSFNSSEFTDVEFQEKKRVPGCCCCYTLTGRLLCFGICTILLIGLGLAAYFLYPRIPSSSDVTVSSTSITPANRTNPFIIDATNKARPRFASTLNVPIKVKSNNYIPWPMQQLNITLFLKTSFGKTAVGQGNLYNFVIAPKSQTTLTVPLVFNYTVGADQESSFVLSTILDKCGITDGKRKDLNVEYLAQVTLAFGSLSESLPRPSFTGSLNFACPISQRDIEKAVKDLNL
jgi:hypothetical protein